MQMDREDPNDNSNKVTGYFPALRTTVLNEVDSYLQSTNTNSVSTIQNLPVMKKIFL